jgi:hypothetical protein
MTQEEVILLVSKEIEWLECLSQVDLRRSLEEAGDDSIAFFFVREMSFPRPKPIAAYLAGSCDDSRFKVLTTKFFTLAVLFSYMMIYPFISLYKKLVNV